MTRSALDEYTAAVRPRYRAARRAEKTRILGEFCQTTGMHRKAAVLLLNRETQPRAVGRGRCRLYRPEALDRPSHGRAWGRAGPESPPAGLLPSPSLHASPPPAPQSFSSPTARGTDTRTNSPSLSTANVSISLTPAGPNTALPVASSNSA